MLGMVEPRPLEMRGLADSTEKRTLLLHVLPNQISLLKVTSFGRRY